MRREILSAHKTHVGTIAITAFVQRDADGEVEAMWDPRVVAKQHLSAHLGYDVVEVDDAGNPVTAPDESKEVTT